MNMDKKSYFTDDVREQIREMSNEDMKNALKSLEGTPAWFAIIKYGQERIASIQSIFLTIDPLKSASEISRYQGTITGILDLQDAVLTLKYESKKAENPKYKQEKNLNELGGAYAAY